MDEQEVSDLEARYFPLDDEELIAMSNRRNTLVPEAVVALDRVIVSRNINIPAVAHSVVEERVVEEIATQPSRATYLLHGLALALSTPLVQASFPLSAINCGSKAGMSLPMMLHRVSLSIPRYPWISRLRVAMMSRQGICGLVW